MAYNGGQRAEGRSLPRLRLTEALHRSGRSGGCEAWHRRLRQGARRRADDRAGYQRNASGIWAKDGQALSVVIEAIPILNAIGPDRGPAAEERRRRRLNSAPRRRAGRSSGTASTTSPSSATAARSAIPSPPSRCTIRRTPSRWPADSCSRALVERGIRQDRRSHRHDEPRRSARERSRRRRHGDLMREAVEALRSRNGTIACR